MALILIIVGWYVSGLIGSALALEFFHRRSRSLPRDIDIGDVMFGMTMALIGPINLLIGMGFAVAWLIGGLMDTERVILKAKQRD